MWTFTKCYTKVLYFIYILYLKKIYFVEIHFLFTCLALTDVNIVTKQKLHSSNSLVRPLDLNFPLHLLLIGENKSTFKSLRE